MGRRGAGISAPFVFLELARMVRIDVTSDTAACAFIYFRSETTEYRTDGWPTQARFWLEWGRSDLPTLSSRPERITAKRWSAEWTDLLLRRHPIVRDAGENRNGRRGNANERRNTLSGCRTAPLKPKPGLNGPAVPPTITTAGNKMQMLGVIVAFEP